MNIKDILLIITILLLLYVVYDFFNYINTEHYVNIPKLNNNSIKWKLDKNCKYDIIKVYKEVLEKHNIDKSNDDNWALYMPCSYNEIMEELKTANSNIIKNNLNDIDKRIFVLNNCDEITAKDSLWKNLVEKYNRDTAKTMMPTTYILNNDNDMKLFEEEHVDDKIYIIKKNIQRQEGLLITKDKSIIINSKKDGFVIAQELLQNPYTINKRKINMRIYLLIICVNNKIGAFIYNDGFMYYTKSIFEKGSTDTDPNITTGYIDRKIYEVNPLTIQDFKKYLDSNRIISFYELDIISKNNIKISDYVFNEINILIKKMVISIKHKICNKNDFKNNIQFQIFGVDVSLSDKLVPQIMEVNKGPDLGYKDDRDKYVKFSVVEDAFKILGIIKNDNNNGYIEIY
jgi:hypothetical protein